MTESPAWIRNIADTFFAGEMGGIPTSMSFIPVILIRLQVLLLMAIIWRTQDFRHTGNANRFV